MLTLESAREELREARRWYRLVLKASQFAIRLPGDAHDLGKKRYEDASSRLLTAFSRYRYARCVDLDYATRLEDHGINLRELRALVIGGGA